MTADEITARALHVLSDRHRRTILKLLREENPRFESEFTISEFLNAVDEPEISEIDLYHAHLPKLADAGFIEWDRDTMTVRRGNSFHAVSVLMDAVEEHASSSINEGR